MPTTSHLRGKISKRIAKISPAFAPFGTGQTEHSLVSICLKRLIGQELISNRFPEWPAA